MTSPLIIELVLPFVEGGLAVITDQYLLIGDYAGSQQEMI